MQFGNCKNCNAEFKNHTAKEVADGYGGNCFECALASPEYNPYGYQNYEPLEVRRAKYNKSVVKS